MREELVLRSRRNFGRGGRRRLLDALELAEVHPHQSRKNLEWVLRPFGWRLRPFLVPDGALERVTGHRKLVYRRRGVRSC
jgi:hypothetical protein